MGSTQVFVATIAVIAVVMIVSAVVMFRLRSSLYLEMSNAIESGDYERFFARVQGRACRLLISPYARGLLLFKAYAAQGRRDQMVEQYNLLMRLKLSEFTRTSLLFEGFAAFAQARDRKRCRRIIKGMEEAQVSEESLRAYRQYYDIVLDGKTSELGRIERMLPSLVGRRRGYAEYLLAAMHATLGDGKQDELRRLAAADLGVDVDDLDRGVKVGTAL